MINLQKNDGGLTLDFGIILSTCEREWHLAAGTENERQELIRVLDTCRMPRKGRVEIPKDYKEIVRLDENSKRIRYWRNTKTKNEEPAWFYENVCTQITKEMSTKWRKGDDESEWVVDSRFKPSTEFPVLEYTQEILARWADITPEVRRRLADHDVELAHKNYREILRKIRHT